MTVSEIMRSYCVRVNGGSGVLVNAMTQEYSYVLTAAHVIPEKQDDLVVHDYRGNQLTVLAVLPQHLSSPEQIESERQYYDFAILKVDYQEHIVQKCLPASDLNNLASLTLIGFPETERCSSDPIKEYTGHKIGVANELVMVSLDGIPGKESIRGMSGGGVYHVQDDTPLLIGVEFQMDGTGQEQQYGRVQCHSLVRFEEIITAHSSARMIPAYLECFSRVKDLIFEFNVIDQNNVCNLKVALENYANNLIDNGLPPPYKIMADYNTELLVDPASLSELETRQLWVAYLEFLVISALMDNSGIIDDTYIKSLERKRRLLYTSDNTNWISRLEELLKAARKHLDRNGTLIVASPDLSAKHLPPDFHLENVISNIAHIPSQGPFAIDEAEGAIYTSFKLTHLEGLRNKCVIDGEFEYFNLRTDIQQLQLFRDKLSEIIN